MFIEMLRKTFPRTWQAAVALVCMLIASQQALTGLQALVVQDAHRGAWGIIKLLGSVVIGIAALIVFYYYQSLAGAQPSRTINPLETLNKSIETQRKEDALRHSATPVFSSHQGEIKPPGQEKTPIV